ncbi:hypothetical protein PSP6_180012 [Paraburkholderia tropica]|nr:hypothetical protein PSP6_180012 [Paraburkholderia tropica]
MQRACPPLTRCRAAVFPLDGAARSDKPDIVGGLVSVNRFSSEDPRAVPRRYAAFHLLTNS